MAIRSNKHADGHVSASYPVKTSVQERDRRFAITSLTILMLIICFQNITFFKVGKASIKPCQLIAIALFLVSVAKRRGAWLLLNIWLTLFFVLMTVLSFVDFLVYGLSASFFKYVFFYIVVAAVFGLGQGLTAENLRCISQNVDFAFLVIILLRIVYYRQAILSFFADSWGSHPSIPSIFGGGVNLDASWLALFGVFFNRDLKENLFLVGSLGVSALYASRGGMVLTALVLFYVYLVKPRDRAFLKKALIILLVAAAALIAVSAFGEIIVDRFLSIGNGVGSEGRLNMRQYPLVTFLDAPILGAGAGNAVKHVSMVSGTYFWEGNIHNFFLQVLLDFGIVGFVANILMLGRLVLEFVRGGPGQLLSLSPLLGCRIFPAVQRPGCGAGLRSWLPAFGRFDGCRSQSRRLGRAACFGCAAW
ncbi:O-antigen ligase family protein [Schaalia naturae]|uniref:O-antigen ligase family protein n=1 Tax=Schaalia naturae TaxID=635203 RepID=A0ABW2SID6_9ACTO